MTITLLGWTSLGWTLKALERKVYWVSGLETSEHYHSFVLPPPLIRCVLQFQVILITDEMSWSARLKTPTKPTGAVPKTASLRNVTPGRCNDENSKPLSTPRAGKSNGEASDNVGVIFIFY